MDTKRYPTIAITSEMLAEAERLIPFTQVNRTKASLIDTLTGHLGEMAFAQLYFGDWRKHRIGKKELGFSAELQSKKDQEIGVLLEKLETQDLLKYGLIPEFIGRVPVTVSLHELDEVALVQILKEPKNALVRQYQRLFDMDGVKLEFEDDALTAIAKLAIERGTGARGLRSIVENVMMDIMFDIPSRTDIELVLVTEESISQVKQPVLTLKGMAHKTPDESVS